MLKPKISFKETAFGWDGLTTFIFSNFLLLITFGIGFLFLFFRTFKIASQTSVTFPVSHNTCQTILVAGLRLENNQPTDEFKLRLNRVVALCKTMSAETKIIILGGLTGDNSISEAKAGAKFLIEQGIDEQAITTEDHSRHTLENLQNARVLLTGMTSSNNSTEAIIISSRYHLHRILTLGKGLNLTLYPVAAEGDFNQSFLNLLLLLKETYYLHWYWSGKIWVFITLNKKSQARIS